MCSVTENSVIRTWRHRWAYLDTCDAQIIPQCYPACKKTWSLVCRYNNSVRPPHTQEMFSVSHYNWIFCVCVRMSVCVLLKQLELKPDVGFSLGIPAADHTCCSRSAGRKHKIMIFQFNRSSFFGSAQRGGSRWMIRCETAAGRWEAVGLFVFKRGVK